MIEVPVASAKFFEIYLYEVFTAFVLSQLRTEYCGTPSTIVYVSKSTAELSVVLAKFV